MIEPTETDIGRRVVYRAGYPGAPLEEGIITSLNAHSVFVRYGSNVGSAGTDRRDLEWADAELTSILRLSDDPLTNAAADRIDQLGQALQMMLEAVAMDPLEIEAKYGPGAQP